MARAADNAAHIPAKPEPAMTICFFMKRLQNFQTQDSPRYAGT